MTEVFTTRLPGAETALVFAVAQIVEGEAECFCGSPAVLTVQNGADPDLEPVCFEHGDEWLGFTRASVAGLFGPKS